MKLPVCDFCVMESKVTIAKYSGSTAMKGNRITMCKDHRGDWKKISSDAKKVMDFLINVAQKSNELSA